MFMLSLFAECVKGKRQKITHTEIEINAKLEEQFSQLYWQTDVFQRLPRCASSL